MKIDPTRTVTYLNQGDALSKAGRGKGREGHL